MLQKLHLIKNQFAQESDTNRFHSTIYHKLARGSVAQTIFKDNFEALTIGYLAYMTTRLILFIYVFRKTQTDFRIRERTSQYLQILYFLINLDLQVFLIPF